MPERTTLYWKYEDGPPGADGDDPNDVGPAWIIEPDGAERDIQEGAWITRAEAVHLAKEHGFELDMDDGLPEDDDMQTVERVDLEALNRRLREIGLSASELLVTVRGKDDFTLSGTIPDEHARRDGPEITPGEDGYTSEPHLIQYSVLGATGLYKLLDRFAPDWR